MSNATEVQLQIKIENGKNIRVFCSTTAFENIRKITIETTASNYALEKTENRDISGKVVIETIKTKEKNTRSASNICHQHVQMYSTTSTLLINGTQVQRLVKRYYQYYNQGQIRTKRK